MSPNVGYIAGGFALGFIVAAGLVVAWLVSGYLQVTRGKV